MSTLLLTDLHLSNKSFKGTSLLECQTACLIDIIEEEAAQEVIIMGDIFMQRRPSPSALLALEKILSVATMYADRVVLMRGNHDSETKADNGVTALSIFEATGSDCDYHGEEMGVKVITHTNTEDHMRRVYIPHYEDQSTILQALREVPEGYTVFGHFGFVGCLNSIGDKDFNISLKEFNNPTYLGHIHKHFTDWNGEHSITVLGTPYTTNFGEEGKSCYYGIDDQNDDNYIFKEVLSGPRHLVINYKDLAENFESYKDKINNSMKSTLLRLNIEKDDKVDDHLLSQLDLIYLDFRFSPLEESVHQDQSEYQPVRELFSVNDQIIEDYVDKHNTSLDKEDIMWGLGILKDEDR